MRSENWSLKGFRVKEHFVLRVGKSEILFSDLVSVFLWDSFLSLCLQLLLGYLPRNSDEWERVLLTKRGEYELFMGELIIKPVIFVLKTPRKD